MNRLIRKFRDNTLRDKFDGMLKNFPKVYKSIEQELKGKEFIVELEYRSVILLEQMMQKPINQIFFEDE